MILEEVWRPLLGLFVWDCVVTAVYLSTPLKPPSLPLALFGSALALFLSFRVTSAYQRWWEGRILWGSMINASRSLARAARSFLSEAEEQDLRRTIVLRQVAYVNALRCQLRRQPPEPEIARFLNESDAADVVSHTNIANAVLDGTGERIDQGRRNGWIDTILQAQMETVLIDIANAQGGMERLKNTPLPNQYRFFPSFFTRLFCLLLPIGLVGTLGVATPIGSTLAGLMFLAALQIGDDLVDPFSNTSHDVPLSAMCRTIEIDLLEGLGEAALPPIRPEHGILW